MELYQMEDQMELYQMEDIAYVLSEADVFWKLSSNAEFLAYKQLICREDIYQKTDKTMKILIILFSCMRLLKLMHRN